MSAKFLEGSDLAEREEQVLKEASLQLGFKPTKLLGRSAWWTSNKIGAFHYEGIYKGRKAILKIQGVKPTTSEIYMIQSFEKSNQSKILRPPHLYDSIPWDDTKRYEALVLEFTGDETVVDIPSNKEEIEEFFKLYKDYKNNCLKSPWIDKPEENLSQKIEENFQKWRETSFIIYPNHPLREEKDLKLIDEALRVLQRGYRDVDPEFQHGHFGSSDLYRVGNQVLILSNLYWSWRAPLYDAIFAYHWFIYHLGNINGITPQEVEEQRNLWLSEIRSLPQVQGKEELLNLALLERATAGLNLDALSVDTKKPIASYLVESTRKIVKDLIVDLR